MTGTPLISTGDAIVLFGSMFAGAVFMVRAALMKDQAPDAKNSAASQPFATGFKTFAGVWAMAAGVKFLGSMALTPWEEVCRGSVTTLAGGGACAFFIGLERLVIHSMELWKDAKLPGWLGWLEKRQ